MENTDCLLNLNLIASFSLHIKKLMQDWNLLHQNKHLITLLNGLSGQATTNSHCSRHLHSNASSKRSLKFYFYDN